MQGLSQSVIATTTRHSTPTSHDTITLLHHQSQSYPPGVLFATMNYIVHSIMCVHTRLMRGNFSLHCVTVSMPCPICIFGGTLSIWCKHDLHVRYSYFFLTSLREHQKILDHCLSAIAPYVTLLQVRDGRGE